LSWFRCPTCSIGFGLLSDGSLSMSKKQRVADIKEYTDRQVKANSRRVAPRRDPYVESSQQSTVEIASTDPYVLHDEDLGQELPISDDHTSQSDACPGIVGYPFGKKRTANEVKYGRVASIDSLKMPVDVSGISEAEVASADPYILHDEGEFDADMSYSEANSNKVRLILFGSPGKGKSTLGNCLLRKIAFSSGITTGGVLTTRVAEETCEDVVVVDTPGIANASAKSNLAIINEVRKTLKQGNRCKIVFVVTEQQSRIHQADTIAIKVILTAAPEIAQNYGIVVNQCSEELMQLSRRPTWRTKFEKFLLSNLPFPTRHVTYYPLDKKLNYKSDHIVALDQDTQRFFNELPTCTIAFSPLHNCASFSRALAQKGSFLLNEEQRKHRQKIARDRRLEERRYSKRSAASKRLGIQLKWVLSEFPQQCNAKALAYLNDSNALHRLIEEIRPPLAPRGTLGRQLAKHALEAAIKSTDKGLESKILAKVEDADMPFLRNVEQVAFASEHAGEQSTLDEMNFRDWAAIVAVGEKAFGKGKTCPRDGKIDCSIVDALSSFDDNGPSGAATFFISWVWQYEMKMVLSALRRWQRNQGSKIVPEKCFLWWCFFQNNQFRILEKPHSLQSTEALANVFGQQLLQVGRMLLVMDKIEGATYLTRVWCVYELYTATKKRIPIEILFPDHATDEFDCICKGGIENIRNAVRIDVARAEATSKDDEIAIKEEIEKESSFNQVSKKASSALAASLIKMLFNPDGVESE